MKIWRNKITAAPSAESPAHAPGSGSHFDIKAVVVEGAISITQPTVIYCGGGLTTDDPPMEPETLAPRMRKFFEGIQPYIDLESEEFQRQALGNLNGKSAANINLVHKLLGFRYLKASDADRPMDEIQYAMNKDIAVYHVSYDSTEKCLENLERAQNCPNSFYSDEAMEFVNRVLGPCVAHQPTAKKTTGKWNIKAASLPTLDEAKQQLRQITILGNSYGTSFIIETENAFSEYLKQLGYDKEKSKDLMRSVMAIGFGNIGNYLGAKGPRFSSVFMEGVNDKVAQLVNPFKYPVANPSFHAPLPKKGITVETPEHFGNYLEMIPAGEGRALMLTLVNPHMSVWRETSKTLDSRFIDRDHTGHHLAFYTHRGTPLNIQPEILERAVRNAAVRNEHPLKDIADLFAPHRPLGLVRHSETATHGMDPIARHVSDLITKSIAAAGLNQNNTKAATL